MAYAMVDMELGDDQKLDALPIATEAKVPGPEYPWGLRITLTEADIEKLGLDPSEAFVGGYVHLHAMACITCAPLEKQADGSMTCQRMELQIEKLCVESEDEENDEAEEAPAKPARRGLYGT